MQYYDLQRTITRRISRKMEAALNEFRHEGVKLLSHLQYRVVWDPASRETVLLSWGVGGREHEQMRLPNEVALEIELLLKANELLKQASLTY